MRSDLVANLIFGEVLDDEAELLLRAAAAAVVATKVLTFAPVDAAERHAFHPKAFTCTVSTVVGA